MTGFGFAKGEVLGTLAVEPNAPKPSAGLKAFGVETRLAKAPAEGPGGALNAKEAPNGELFCDGVKKLEPSLSVPFGDGGFDGGSSGFLAGAGLFSGLDPGVSVREAELGVLKALLLLFGTRKALPPKTLVGGDEDGSLGPKEEGNFFSVDVVAVLSAALLGDGVSSTLSVARDSFVVFSASSVDVDIVILGLESTFTLCAGCKKEDSDWAKAPKPFDAPAKEPKPPDLGVLKAEGAGDPKVDDFPGVEGEPNEG